MNEQKAKHFEQTVQAFTNKFQQDVVQYLSTIEQQGFTIQDIKDYHEYKLEKIRQENKIIEKILKERAIKLCPECSGQMFCYPVNDAPERMTGDFSDKSVWLCQNVRCLHTIFNAETIEQIKKRGK